MIGQFRATRHRWNGCESDAKPGCAAIAAVRADIPTSVAHMAQGRWLGRQHRRACKIRRVRTVSTAAREVVPVEFAEFEPMVRARAAAWRRVAYAVCGDWAAADDALQVALLRLVKHWRRLRPDTVLAYARTAVVNAAVDELRRPHRRFETGSDEAVLETVSTDPEAGDGDDRPEVRSALSALPPAQRSVLALRYFDGCSVEETAAALKISPATVSSQTSRALAALRRALGPVSDEKEARS
jgi:RNA polymerase sigma factor (sigma-70 family)